MGFVIPVPAVWFDKLTVLSKVEEESRKCSAPWTPACQAVPQLKT
jgi:hypothetical protein